MSAGRKALPEWMKEMPPIGTKEYLSELRERVSRGKAVRVRAVFHRFYDIGGSQFSLGPEGEHTWSTTICRIVSPERFVGWMLPVNHSSKLPADSCWRRQGCTVEFDVNERIIEAENARIRGFTEMLFKEQLENLKVTMPGAGGKAAQVPKER